MPPVGVKRVGPMIERVYLLRCGWLYVSPVPGCWEACITVVATQSNATVARCQRA